MERYVFVCIGTNKLIEDSFGPRVGDILMENFSNYSNVEVLGTMNNPIHFQNAPVYKDYLSYKKGNVVVIDSAFGKKEAMGNTYINAGGIEIGKALGRSLYFPADLNIKTVVGNINLVYNKPHLNSYEMQNAKAFNNIQYDRVENINCLAQKLASEISQIFIL